MQQKPSLVQKRTVRWATFAGVYNVLRNVANSKASLSTEFPTHTSYPHPPHPPPYNVTMSGDVDCSRFLNTLKDAESLRSQWQGASWEELKQCALSNAERIVSVDRTERTEGKSALANQTREWVVLPDEEKIPSIKGDQGLLRMYQNYIVTLTRQVDVTESAFLKVYKLLDALPDPAQPLAALAEQAPCVSKLAEDNATLRERAASLEQIVASHQQELSELQNQEVTVNQLKEDLRAAKIESQAALDRASEERAAAWDVEREVLLDEVRGREESLTRQLAAQVSERTQQQQLNDAVQDEVCHTSETFRTELPKKASLATTTTTTTAPDDARPHV